MTNAIAAGLVQSLPLLIPVLLGLGYHFLQGRNAKAAALIKDGIVLAFHATEEAKRLNLLPASVSPEAHALEQLDAIVEAQGGSVSDDAKSLAVIAWRAMSSQASAPALPPKAAS